MRAAVPKQRQDAQYGLVEYDYHSDITTLLKEADEKLYIGKEGGRDRIVF